MRFSLGNGYLQGSQEFVFIVTLRYMEAAWPITAVTPGEGVGEQVGAEAS